MQKKPRQVLIEIGWIAISLGLTLVLSFCLFGRSMQGDSIDILLYDTYFVISPWYILVPIFQFFTFIIYFIKEFPYSFRRTLPKWVLVIIGFTLVITLTLLIQTFSQFFTVGWTTYPPLSALAEDPTPKLTHDPVAKSISHVFRVVQAIVLIMLLFVTFRGSCQKRTTDV